MFSPFFKRFGIQTSFIPKTNQYLDLILKNSTYKDEAIETTMYPYGLITMAKKKKTQNNSNYNN